MIGKKLGLFALLKNGKDFMQNYNHLSKTLNNFRSFANQSVLSMFVFQNPLIFFVSVGNVLKIVISTSSIMLK